MTPQGAESPRETCAGRPWGHKAPAVCASFLTTQSSYAACPRAANAPDCAQRARSNPPCLRKALLTTSACSALRRSKPCVGADKKDLCLCHTLQLPSSKRLFCLDEGTCSSQGNSAQMYPNLNNLSSHSHSFTSVCARMDAELHQEPKLAPGVAALQALQAWYSGCHFAASDELRHHGLSHDRCEVAPELHDPDTHSHSIHR